MPNRSIARSPPLLSAWFGVQGLVAVWGIAFGRVGGLAWVAVVADPLIAGWFIALSAKVSKG